MTPGVHPAMKLGDSISEAVTLKRPKVSYHNSGLSIGLSVCAADG
jgi:hypothetical protein